MSDRGWDFCETVDAYMASSEFGFRLHLCDTNQEAALNSAATASIIAVETEALAEALDMAICTGVPVLWADLPALHSAMGDRDCDLASYFKPEDTDFFESAVRLIAAKKRAASIP